MSKKRILFTVTHLGPGGVQNLVMTLAARLAERQWEPSVVSFAPVTTGFQLSVFDTARRKGIQVQSPARELRNPIERLHFAESAVHQFQPDIVHAHTPMPHKYVVYACRASHIPIVATFHNNNMWPTAIGELRAQLALRLFLNHRTNAYVGISASVSKMMVTRYGIPPSKVLTITNAIDVTDIKRRASAGAGYRSSIGLNADDFMVVNVAQTDFSRKRQDFLVGCIPELLTAIPQARVVFVGDGPDSERLAQLSRSLGKAIVVLGARGDVPEILGAADVSVLVSRREGLPVALLESMAAGTPCVCTAVGSIPDVIQNGRNGLLLDTASATDFASLCSRLHREKNLADSIARTAAEDVLCYDLEPWVNSHVLLYEGLLRRVDPDAVGVTPMCTSDSCGSDLE